MSKKFFIILREELEILLLFLLLLSNYPPLIMSSSISTSPSITINAPRRRGRGRRLPLRLVAGQFPRLESICGNNSNLTATDADLRWRCGSRRRLQQATVPMNSRAVVVLQLACKSGPMNFERPSERETTLNHDREATTICFSRSRISSSATNSRFSDRKFTFMASDGWWMVCWCLFTIQTS